MFDAPDSDQPAPAVSAGPGPARGRMFDVGGRRLHVTCDGPRDGRPPILLEAGSFGVGADWARVQEKLARTRRTLAYDRAGLGLSDPGPEPRDADAVVDDLQALLAATNLRGSYILVGHSTAAAYVQLFALRRPEAVCGLVLIDAIPAEAMGDRKVAERVRGAERFAGLAPWAARMGLLRAADGLAGDPIGLPEVAAAEKRAAFASERHNHWGAVEAREQLRDGETVRAFARTARGRRHQHRRRRAARAPGGAGPALAPRLCRACGGRQRGDPAGPSRGRGRPGRGACGPAGGLQHRSVTH